MLKVITTHTRYVHRYFFIYASKFQVSPHFSHNSLSGLRGSGIQKSIIAGIVIVKYVALPLTGILIVKVALKLGLVTDDPLYLFVLMLQFSVPPAMNMGMYHTAHSFCRLQF